MKYTFFWDGPFSQWHPSKFIIDGVEFNTAEQYMMACKANLFGDYKALDKIMKSDNPRIQKQFGREVEYFDEKIWSNWCRKFVYDGNIAKFNQNEDLKNELENTVGTLLVEASPYDTVWGIGLSEDDPDRFKPELWKGKNYLGEVLTIVRATLFNINDEFVHDYFKKQELWMTPELNI